MTFGGRLIDASGGVVWRRRPNGKLEFLVVHRPRYNDWTLPKGKLDRRETFEACAEREVREETGSRVKMGDEIGTIAYPTPQGNTKRVRYWVMEHIDGTFVPNSEVNRIQWLRARRARATLSYPRDGNVLDRGIQLARRPESGRIYLVRHALAGDRKQWVGNDRKRPLSKRGRRQALGLQDNLSSLPITDVLSSRWARCTMTVGPLADSLGIETVKVRALAEGGAPETITELIRSLRGRTAVLCSHGDVISNYIHALQHSGVRIDGPAKWRKASTWVLETRNGAVRTARYLPPAVA